MRERVCVCRLILIINHQIDRHAQFTIIVRSRISHMLTDRIIDQLFLHIGRHETIGTHRRTLFRSKIATFSPFPRAYICSLFTISYLSAAVLGAIFKLWIPLGQFSAQLYCFICPPTKFNICQRQANNSGDAEK